MAHLMQVHVAVLWLAVSQEGYTVWLHASHVDVSHLTVSRVTVSHVVLVRYKL